MSLNLVLSWFVSSLFPLILFLSFLVVIIKRVTSKNIKLPPSPPKLPFIGNLHQLLSSPLAHYSLHTLSKKYGPLMLLQLGQVPTLVVSSPNFAKEIMKTHDAIFASRPPTKSVRLLSEGTTDLVFAPYGEYWKQLRRLCVTHLLGSKMVQSFRRVREEEVTFLINDISVKCTSSRDGPIDMTEVLNLYSNNVYSRAILGKSYRDEGKDSIFCELTHEDVILINEFCFEDCFPLFGWLDKFTGLERRLKRNSQRWYALLDEVIEERRKELKEEGCQPEHKHFVDVLLDLQNDPGAELPVDRALTKTILVDMIAASTDASFIVLEWGLAELIRNPQVMQKLKDEVRGTTNRECSMIKEEDLSNMNYLKAVVKEILRLHPSVPLLIPRKSMQACIIQGYEIPKGIRVIINAWTIGRDPEFWDAPEEFQPERFLNSSVDLLGHDFELIPFGAGRRICPGVQFAITTLELSLANLVLRFDWKLPEGMALEDMDMNESPGLTTRKKEKLQLVVEPAVTM